MARGGAHARAVLAAFALLLLLPAAATGAPAPHQPSPRHPASHQSASHQPASRHPAPHHPAPHQPAPRHPAPHQPAPYHPAPQHPAPRHPASYHPSQVVPVGRAAPAPPGPVPAPPRPAPAAPRTYPVRVDLAGVSPAVPAEDDTVTLTGTLTNHSDEAVTKAHLGARVGAGGAVATRSEVAAVEARGPLAAPDGAAADEPTEPVDRLAAGGRREFRLRVPVEVLGPRTPGAYPLTVALTGRGGAVYGLTRTFLPWYPAGTDAEPLRTTVFWPLTDVPHMQALTLGSGDAAQPVFRNDALAASFAPGGRLRRLVEAGRGRPVTWLVDPDLIVEAQAMVDGYRVARTPDTTDPQDSTEGRGGDDAADWLAALRAAVRGREVEALPYADPDLASLAHSGRSEQARQARRGRAVVDEALGVRARQDLGWPEAGALDTSIVHLAQRLRMRAVLASGVGLSGAPGGWGAAGPTDDGPVALGGGLAALTYDTTLADLLDGGGAARPVAPLRQRLLAETLTAVGEAPNAPRGLVVLPPRRMSGTTARALAATLAEGMESGWLEPVSPAAALRDPVAGRAGPVAEYPAVLRDTELPPARLRAVARDGRLLRSLVQVLADPGYTDASVRAALARSVSTAWRGRPAGNRAYVHGTTEFLRTSMESVRLVPKSTVTVAGDSATIPVTVENALQQAVSGIEVRVVSGRPERLTVVDGSVAAEASRTASRTVRVEVRAHANGPVRLTAQLFTTSDGRPWGAPITFRADVRSVSSGAVTIVAGGVLLIVLAVVFQLGRARRRRTR
ncbi:DUF6049 family protein [Streptomyces sp. NPDC018031]|uniref:DUF6049 family protein n=1 Tax=Streptomyces sp. NPDC018031 TaxID=3365033 RepID=UPI0037B2AEEE